MIVEFSRAILRQLANANTHTVSFNGFEPFQHDVVDATPLLEKLHTAANVTKEQLTNYVNSGSYKGHVFLESLFAAIKSQGAFKIKGMGSVGNHYFKKTELTEIINQAT